MYKQKIFLVIENGTGTIHTAHTTREAAEKQLKALEEQTGLNCYEIQTVGLYA